MSVNLPSSSSNGFLYGAQMPPAAAAGSQVVAANPMPPVPFPMPPGALPLPAVPIVMLPLRQHEEEIRRLKAEADSKQQALEKELATAKSEIAKLQAQVAQLNRICNAAFDALACVKCNKRYAQNFVIGPCGHNMCRLCVQEMREAISEKLSNGVSTYEIFSKHICPVSGCGHPILGSGFQNKAVHQIAQILKPGTSMLPYPARNVKKEAQEWLYITHTEIAKTVVAELHDKITETQLEKGFFVVFNPYTSFFFFDAFTHLYSEKVGSKAIGINRENRVLKIQRPGASQPAPTEKCLVVNVESNGNFTISEEGK